MPNYIEATITLQDNRYNSEKTMVVPIYAPEKWHNLPRGLIGEYLDISVSAEILYWIELELVGD